MQVNILVGGEAGQGVQTIGYVLGKALSRGGLYVFADQDYESRVRGGHNFFRVRVSDSPVGALAEKVDILIALNKDSFDRHQGEVAGDGLVILDREKVDAELSGPRLLDIPLEKIALDAASDKVMSNSVATGAAIGSLGQEFDALSGVLREHFARAGSDVAEKNVKAARAGYEFFAKSPAAPGGKAFKPSASAERCMFLNGNEAIALGALAAGMKFMAAYPMTPTTSIMEYISDKARDLGVVMAQSEDEISAINMVIGASYAGVRAMTATSGSGFCLMTEALGLSGITETPAVVVLGQRPGPAVGLPTRTEQGELLFACFAGTGEFPRAVLAPATIEDCFSCTVQAFNLAEKYQTLAIILTDQSLATCYQTVARFDLKGVRIERGALLSTEEAETQAGYKRHALTDSGVSPRAFPMQGKALVVTDSDEHNEEGHLIEDAQTRRSMMLKRLRKQEGLKAEVNRPWLNELPGAKATLVGWGSSYGAIAEACQALKKDGTTVNHLQLNQVWPFPAAAVAEALSKTQRSYVVESNATGQLARLIKAETGIEASGRINRFDGRPLLPQDIVPALKEAS